MLNGFRDYLAKSKAAPKKKPTAKKKSTPKTPAGPVERPNPMISPDSPLTRAICKAANLPDVEALMMALTHPMTDDEMKALGDRAGGHAAHHHRVKHLRKLALDKQAPQEQKLAKSANAFLHHSINQGKGVNTRGGHAWWNPSLLAGQGGWDYHPKPTGEPDHAQAPAHQQRIAQLDQQAVELGARANIMGRAWVVKAPSKEERDYIANHKPVEQVHLDLLRNAWIAAKADHQKGGMSWYPEVYETCKLWSADTHTDAYTSTGKRPLSPEEIAMIIAVSSPQMDWTGNMAVAHYAIFGFKLPGYESKQVKHTGSVMQKIETVMSGNYTNLTNILTTAGDLTHDQLMDVVPKTYSFWRNICGIDNGDTCTIDRHMFAIMGMNQDNRGVHDYKYCRRALNQVAAELGVDPRDLQAITWTWYEDEIAPKVLRIVRSAIKNRELNNNIYMAHYNMLKGLALKPAHESALKTVQGTVDKTRDIRSQIATNLGKVRAKFEQTEAFNTDLDAKGSKAKRREYVGTPGHTIAVQTLTNLKTDLKNTARKTQLHARLSDLARRNVADELHGKAGTLTVTASDLEATIQAALAAAQAKGKQYEGTAKHRSQIERLDKLRAELSSIQRKREELGHVG